jgi:hypothetical protein
LAAALLLWKYDEFATLRLNEWGDFLAGVAAPVALLWLVLGYLQQGIELRQNTEALRLQYQELRSQVKETAALAKSAGRQAAAAESLVAVTNDSARQAAERAEAVYQPQLYCEGCSGGPSGRKMTMSNIGASVTSVTVRLVQSGRVSPLLEMENWFKHDQYQVVISDDWKFPLFLKVEFTNGLQARRVHYYRIPHLGKLMRMGMEDGEYYFGEATAG